MLNTLYLIKSVPFDKSYEHVVTFDNEVEQRAYFVSKGGLPITTVQFDEANGMVIIDKSFNVAQEYSYMMWFYTDLEGKQKYKYGFIDTVTRVDEKRSRLHFTLDVWQTYQFNHTIKDAFVKREHQDRFDVSGKPIYNIQKEDIDLGDKYIVEKEVELNYITPTKVSVLGKTSSSETPYYTMKDLLWYYIISSNKYGTNTSAIGKTYKQDGYETNLYLYCVPVVQDITEHSFTYNGSKLHNYAVYMGNKTLNSGDLEKVARDNSTIAIYVSNTAPIDIDISTDITTGSLSNTFNIRLTPKNYSERIGKEFDLIIFEGDTFIYNVFNNNHFQKEFSFNVDLPYKPTSETINIQAHEPKLYTKPFRTYTITNRTTEGLDVGLNELGDKVKILESMGIQYKSLISTNGLDNDSFFNASISTKNNELPLLNDRYLNYIANNKASATTGVALSGMGAVGGILAGGAMLSAGGVSGMLGYMALSQGLSSSKKVMNELINQSDLKQAPLSIREVGNNIQFNLLFREGLSYKIYQRKVLDKYLTRAYNYFTRYGYACNEFKVPNLKSRTRFNYIECTSIDLVGSITNNIKEQLKQIYIKGVTLWHYNTNIETTMYDYTLINKER